MEIRHGLGPHVSESPRDKGRDRQCAHPAAMDYLKERPQVDQVGSAVGRQQRDRPRNGVVSSGGKRIAFRRRSVAPADSATASFHICRSNAIAANANCRSAAATHSFASVRARSPNGIQLDAFAVGGILNRTHVVPAPCELGICRHQEVVVDRHRSDRDSHISEGGSGGGLLIGQHDEDVEVAVRTSIGARMRPCRVCRIG